MEIDGNYRRIDGNCREIDLIQGSHPPWGKKKIRREKCTNALRNWFILQLISHVVLQLCIYRRQALISLAHMASSYWFYYSSCALIISTYAKYDQHAWNCN